MKGKQEKRKDAISYTATSWKEMAPKSKEIWKERVMKLKPSLSDLENLWLTTGDTQWLEIEPPENFYFCNLMLEYLSEENPYRRIAIQQMEDMLPLKHYGGHTKFSILGALVNLFLIQKSDLVWNEMSRFFDEFKYAEFVYRKTGERKALETAISFCNGGKKSPRLRKLLRECFLEDKSYVMGFLV